MSEVAKLLGVELNEEFDVNCCGVQSYHLTEEGLFDSDEKSNSLMLMFLLAGGEEIIKKPWKPKYGERYFYISIRDEHSYIYENEWEDTSTDYELYHTGNFFRTEKEARKNIEAYKEFNKSLTPNMSWRVD